MNELLKLIPEGTFQVLGFLALLFTLLFKEQIGRLIFKPKSKPEHNPNLDTLDDKMDDIKEILIELKTIIDERLPKK